MVSIRFQRIGRKKEPHFRLIAQDRRKDPWDKALEILGYKNPRTKELKLDSERIKYWLSVGAQPTESVHNLLIDQKIVDGDKKKTVKISKKRAAKIADKNKSAEEPKQEAGQATDSEDKKSETSEAKEESKQENTENKPEDEDKEDKKEENKENQDKTAGAAPTAESTVTAENKETENKKEEEK